MRQCDCIGPLANSRLLCESMRNICKGCLCLETLFSILSIGHLINEGSGRLSMKNMIWRKQFCKLEIPKIHLFGQCFQCLLFDSINVNILEFGSHLDMWRA